MEVVVWSSVIIGYIIIWYFIGKYTQEIEEFLFPSLKKKKDG